MLRISPALKKLLRRQSGHSCARLAVWNCLVAGRRVRPRGALGKLASLCNIIHELTTWREVTMALADHTNYVLRRVPANKHGVSQAKTLFETLLVDADDSKAPKMYIVEACQSSARRHFASVVIEGLPFSGCGEQKGDEQRRRSVVIDPDPGFALGVCDEDTWTRKLGYGDASSGKLFYKIRRLESRWSRGRGDLLHFIN